MSFSKLGAEIWRDFTTAGNPATPAWPVVKADMRAWMAFVEADIGGANTYIAAGWQTATSYSLGDIVWHGSVDYVCILAHTSGASTEPGTGADWEDNWEAFPSTKHPSGSASAPGIAFGADTNTGLYRIAADVLAVATGGTGRIRVDSSALAPVSNDGLALGTASLGWSDAHFATGAVLNFANGNVTVTHSAGNLAFSGAITLGTDLAVTEGGTGASNASGARTNLGLVIGTDVQAWDADLDTLAGLAKTDGNFIVGDGAAWVVESGATARASLGLTIGTHVQAFDALLGSIAGLTFGADNYIYGTGSDTAAAGTITSQGRDLLDDTSFSAMRTTLGLAIGTDVQAYDELLAEIAALNVAPGADRGLFYDHSSTAIDYWVAAGGLEFSTTNLQMTANQRTAVIPFIIDGGGSAISTGIKGDLMIPFACTITSVTMLADQSGSIVVDIWKDTYANYPPTDADSITAAAPPTISTATKSQDSTLTGWTTSIAAGDILRFNVDSITSVTRVLISLTVTKT